MSIKWIKVLFVIAGICDLLIGVSLFLASPQIFRITGVPQPYHIGFVQFPALLVAIVGALFLHIAANPVARRDLIPYLTCVKIAFSGLVFWYQLTIGIPTAWLPLAWCDVGYIILFILAWRSLAPVS